MRCELWFNTSFVCPGACPLIRLPNITFEILAYPPPAPPASGEVQLVKFPFVALDFAEVSAAMRCFHRRRKKLAHMCACFAVHGYGGVLHEACLLVPLLSTDTGVYCTKHTFLRLQRYISSAELHPTGGRNLSCAPPLSCWRLLVAPSFRGWRKPDAKDSSAGPQVVFGTPFLRAYLR